LAWCLLHKIADAEEMSATVNQPEIDDEREKQIEGGRASALLLIARLAELR